MRVKIAGCEGVGLYRSIKKRREGWKLSIDGRRVTKEGIYGRVSRRSRRSGHGFDEGLKEMGRCCDIVPRSF